MAINEDGRIAVMWRNWRDGSRDMYFCESNGDGESFTEAKKLGSGTRKLNGCPMDGDGIVFGKVGKIETAWRREKSSFTASPGTDEVLVSTNAVRPFIVLSDAGRHAFYESKGNVMMTVPEGGESELLTKDASFPSAVSVHEKRIVLAWESNRPGLSGIRACFIEIQKSKP